MKRIRLNTLFIICLSSFVILTFLVLSIVAITNLEKAKKLTEDNSIDNITLLTDSVFTEDVKAYASMINTAFQEYLDLTKLVAINVKHIRNITKSKNQIHLVYDTKTGLFNYIDPRLASLGKSDSGLYAVYYNGNNEIHDKTIIDEIGKLCDLKSFFLEICRQKSDIVNLSIFN